MKTFQEHPHKSPGGGGDLRNGQRPGRVEAALNRTAGIKTEPAHPQKPGPQEGED